MVSKQQNILSEIRKEGLHSIRFTLLLKTGNTNDFKLTEQNIVRKKGKSP